MRPNGLDADSPVVNNLPLVTMSWSSPVNVDESLLDDARVTTLIRSSDASWETTLANPQPDLELYPEFGFPVGGELSSFPLAVAVESSFGSYFVDKPSPFEAGEADAGLDTEAAAAEPIGLIERSPAGTRMVVLGSSEFVNDTVYQISANFAGDRFVSNLQLIANAIHSQPRERSAHPASHQPGGARPLGADQLRGRHHRLDPDRLRLATAAPGGETFSADSAAGRGRAASSRKSRG